MKHIIQKFEALGGKHCITTSMRQIFKYNGYDISEEMLFGLGSGLGLFYGEFGGKPTFGARIRIGEFEDNIAKRLGIKMKINRTSSSKKAYKELTGLIKSDIPVMVYVDMAYLRYLNLPENAHFGGHSIVVFGIDEEKGIAFVSDRDGVGHKMTMNHDEVPEDYHVISLEDLELARGSKFKPYPPENKWVEFGFDGMRAVDGGMIKEAIRVNSETMLKAPIKSVGLKGIHTFSEKVTGWKSFDDEKLKWSAFDLFIMTSHVGGTGGGAFRKMYGNFLREGGRILDSQKLIKIGDEYYETGEQWDTAGDSFLKLHKTLDRGIIDEISGMLKQIHCKEENLMKQLKEFSEN